MRGAVSKATVKINQREAPRTVRAGAGTRPSRNVARGDRVTAERHLTPALPGAWGPHPGRAAGLLPSPACSPPSAGSCPCSVPAAPCVGHLSLHGGSAPTCEGPV